ncbi:TOR1B protein, partial [Polypterus senegalus]
MCAKPLVLPALDTTRRPGDEEEDERRGQSQELQRQNHKSRTDLQLSRLKVELEEKLFGQQLARHAILKAVTGFLNHENSEKPLVLSFHGWSGTGKNYVTKMIAKHLYKKGMRSSFVHHFIATIHFLHAGSSALYKVSTNPLPSLDLLLDLCWEVCGHHQVSCRLSVPL